ncbi:MAG: hypothetical protein DID92_2727744373 [Candidatus Nitrotoga sp. SPKER]|nr:MAG: hypothetical protein DID92_2727744373 [Candidatus Nitrotoga sp. SPKER]
MLQKDIQHFPLAQHATHRTVSTQLIAALLRSVSPRKASPITSYKRSMVICFGLAAGFWCTANTFAQTHPTSPQPEDTDHPIVVTEASSSINWDTIRWVERRYKIEAIRFKARDETGIDWLGSDEVVVETTDTKGWTVSREVGNIDSGDTHNFDPAKSCIVAVRPGIVVLDESSVCEKAGEPAPLSFQVELWEQDSIGFPAGFCVGGQETPEPGRHAGPYSASCPDGSGFNDFIGRAQINYSTQELEAALPNVGDEQIESITLDPCPGQICAGFADYTFTWRVTRLPNALVNLGSVLNEAMQRSGARSELEAITTGLRYLRAPDSHKIKPEIDKLPLKR